MKLFIKLVLIAIYNNKYIDWKKINQELGLSLAGTKMMFHPEEKPFNKILNKKELHSLLDEQSYEKKTQKQEAWSSYLQW